MRLPGPMDVPLWLVLVLCVCVFIYLYYSWNFGYWEKKGIPTARPTLFLGSRPTNYKQVPHLVDIEHRKKYGKIWGEYEGRRPVLLVADADVVKDVMVKHFDCFHDRRFFDLGEAFENSLDMLAGEQWKTVRNILSPGLTSGKLKLGQGIFCGKSAELTESLKREAGEKGAAVDLATLYGFYGLDVIAAFGFGLDINTQKQSDHLFAEHAKRMIDANGFGSPLAMLFFVFPGLAKYLELIPAESGKFFAKAAHDICEHRLKEPATRQDFLGYLVKAIKETPTNPDFKRLRITPRLLENQIQVFLLAGFATVTITMTVASYLLALNPDKQRKLIKEVDAAVESSQGDITHDTLGKLNYMEACINEALRLFPPLIRNERVCTKAVTLRSIELRRGDLVFMSSWAMARDPDYFHDPDSFIPERFEDGRRSHHPYAWTPFGHGPRACIGMRFAYEQIKYALVHVFRELEFYKAAETVDPKGIDFVKGSTFVMGFNNILVGVRPRERK